MSSNSGDVKKIPNYMKFIFSGLSGMAATCVVQPLDLVKTRMQTQGTGELREYKNSFHCMQVVIQKEGPLAIYTGLGAGLLRQATYTTARLGVYSYLNDIYKKQYQSEPNLLSLMGMGVTAGAIGAFVGTPAEVVLIRMTADGRLPVDQRRNYTNVANAFVRIVREEGLFTLWSGSIPTVGRAMVVNMVQLASYSQIKSMLAKSFSMEDGIKLHFCASMPSGFLTTLASMPVDLAKTSIQNMKYEDGKPEYKGTIDVLLKITRRDGILALWKGFTPYFCRLGPHTVLTFMFLEQFTTLYSEYVLGIKSKGSGL